MSSPSPLPNSLKPASSLLRADQPETGQAETGQIGTDSDSPPSPSKPSKQKPVSKKEAGKSAGDEPVSTPVTDGSASSAEERSPGQPPASFDLSEVIAQIDVEMKRTGWTKRQGRDYLKQTYGKATRPELDTDELYDFLNYLRGQPAKGESKP
jgi:hypothetical protein